MLYRKLLLVIMGILLVAFALGCSDDDDDTVTGSNGDDTDTTLVPAVPTAMAELNAPVEAMKNSDNVHVVLASGYVERAKTFSSFLTPPSAAENAEYPGLTADSVVYTWTDGDLTMTMVFKETATHYYWATILDGTLDGITFDNFKLIEAQETITGTSGWLKVFHPTEGLVFEWQWTVDVTGKFTMVLTGSDELTMFEVEIVVNVNGSGHVKYTADDLVIWRVTWNAAGTGGTYEYVVGGTTISGTWPSG